MNFTYLLNKYEFNENILIKHGFINIDNYYFLTINSKIDPSFEYKIKININEITVKCYDKEINELYIPFSLKNNNSKYVLSLKEEINEYLINLFNEIFKKIDIKQNIIDYINNSFSCFLDTPFKKYPSYLVFKREDNKKWFSIFMDIPINKLNKNNKNNDDNERIVEILNIKVREEKINDLIDNKNYFKGYHMNPSHWISVLITKNIDKEELFKLIEESYLLTK